MAKRKNVKKINKLLKRVFEAKVEASVKGDSLLLTGSLERWGDVVKAVMIAAAEATDTCIINDIDCTADKPLPIRKPRILDTAIEFEEPDVLIIGGGIIGCSIARELTRYKLNVMIVEKEHDLAMQATGRSFGLVHSGANMHRGTKKQWYTKQGNEKMESVCEELGVPFKRTGQYIINTKKILPFLLQLKRLYWKIIRGHSGVQIIKGADLHLYEPGVSERIGSALFFPTGGVVDPHRLALAYAENAVQNGANVSLDTMVEQIITEEGIIVGVKTNRGTVHPKFVVNAAGLFAESIAHKAGDRFYSIRPVKNAGIVIDKSSADSLVNTVISVHGKTGKGRRSSSESLNNVIRTVHGTVIVGTPLIETINTEDYSTDRYSMDWVMKTMSRFVPKLDKKQILKYYSGISAATFDGDYIISEGRDVSNIIHIAGIQFPGLTAAPAIAEDVAAMITAKFEARGALSTNPDFNPLRKPTPDTSEMEAGALQGLIEANPDYGIVVCHCENVSRGEIIDSINRVVPCVSVDGVKRRTRAGYGACQGQCCTPPIVRIIAADKHLAQQEVHKCGAGSELVYGAVEIIVEDKKDDNDAPPSPLSPFVRREESDSDTDIVNKLASLGL